MDAKQDSVAVLRAEITAMAAKQDVQVRLDRVNGIMQKITALQSQQVASADRGEAVAYRYKDSRGHWRYVGSRPNFPTEYRSLNPEPLYAAAPPSPAESAEGDAPDWDEGARHTSIVEIARAAGAEKLGVLAAPLKQVAVAGDHGVELREPMEDYFDAGQMHAALDRAAAPSGVSDALDILAKFNALDCVTPAHATDEEVRRWNCPCVSASEAQELLIAAIALRHQPQPGRVEGMVLVPVDPLLAKLREVLGADGSVYREIKAMLAAAPTAGGQEANHG